MADGHRKEEDMPRRHLRRQLAATIQRIQWSYAIFWSLSSGQPSLLEWSDGHYNGDIKTRKTTHPMELKDDKMGLQRSEHLKQLYVSLSAGDSDQTARRPSVLLSPEDLGDLEWYYLVCMSFTFRLGHGLVGRTFTSGRHIWLTDAHCAESKIFTRSLLAKSASIQTLFCCPFMGGVLELGTTETVLEDPDLIQQITTSFWDFPVTVPSEQSLSKNLEFEENQDQIAPSCDQDNLTSVPSENLHPVADCHTTAGDGAAAFVPRFHSHSSIKVAELNEDAADKLEAESSEELETGSPNYSSYDCCPNQHIDDSRMMEGLDDTSEAHSCQFMDDELNNGLHGSLNSSYHKCQPLSGHQLLSSPEGERIKYVNDLRVCHQTEQVTAGTDSSHYRRTLATIFRSPTRTDVVSSFRNSSLQSSFTAWERGPDIPHTPICTEQKFLKKILFNVSSMHGPNPLGHGRKIKAWKVEGDAIGLSHMLSERKREKMNEKFLILKSLLPSVSKTDKASILDDAIKYLKELENRVDNLESYLELRDSEARGRKHPDITERTSDNYGRDIIASGKKYSICKRKACEVKEQGFENCLILSKDGMMDINVTIIEKEVVIQMSCPWRDYLLLEIVDAISNLHLEAHSVQSSNVDGNLSLTIKSKFRDAVVASPGMIKCTLQRVISKC
uniref:Transcription factor GLABRA 3 n=1 Tax=Anthurium amnicola TaxID=1678845 RepID=A0A1D1Z6E0_9ARAE